MNFDIEGARKEGYTDSEIAQHLAIKSRFDYSGAMNEGYNDTDIITHLSKKSISKPKQEATPEPKEPISWSEVPGQSLESIPSSAYEFGKSIYNAVTSPVATVTTIGKVLAGVVSKVAPGTPVAGEPGEEAEKYAEAVGTFFSERYGGIDNLKKTIAKDPVGFLVDASTIASGAGIATTGTRVGAIASKVASATDPLSIIGKTAEIVTGPVKGATKGLVGLTTGKGHAVIDDAIKNSPDFRTALHGGISEDAVVDIAKGGVHHIADKRSEVYRQRLDEIANMPNPPTMDLPQATRSFGDAMRSYKVNPIVSPQGNIIGLDFSRSAIKGNSRAEADFGNLLELFKNAYNDRQFYSTPVGMDTLKRQVGNLYSESDIGRAAVQKVYKETRQQLVDNVPGYARMVGDYEATTTLIKEMHSALGLKDKKSVDTALRKLNTAMKEDQDFRRDLIKVIEEESGKDISSMISGLQLRSWTSNALRSAGATVGGMMSIIYGNLWGVPLVAMASPRLVGETISLLAQGGKAFEKVRGAVPTPTRNLLYQGGRMEALTSGPQALEPEEE